MELARATRLDQVVTKMPVRQPVPKLFDTFVPGISPLLCKV